MNWFAVGALLCGLGVAAGAFGAHGLRGRISAEMLAIFETAVRYQLVHGLGLLAVGWAATRWNAAAIHLAGWLFLGGALLFCGSLYTMALGGARWLGAITPVGGLAWILGWILLAAGALRGS